MARRNRLTNNTDETDIASLISGDSIFSIPYFQRPYKWKTPRLQQLQNDLLSLAEDASDFHFLGAVIVHGVRTNPSDPDLYEVIDGQQRITTLFLYLCATVKTLCNMEEYSEAAGLFLKYLAINRDTGSVSNFKIHSCKEDRAQLRYVYSDVLSDPKLQEKLGGFVLKPLPKSGADSGVLRNNYKYALRFLKDEVEQGGLTRLQQIYRCLLGKMSVVQIDVWDPTNGPKIFDALNSRQEPMTIGDLVRNDIFSKVSDKNPEEIELVDAEYWQPFYEKFNQNGKNLFDNYFFPFGLIKNPNLKKSEVYSFLRAEWASESPKNVVLDLCRYQDAFIDIVSGTNASKLEKGFSESLQRLSSTGLPTSIYPYLMQLVFAVSEGLVDDKTATKITEVLEGFLVRRAICGLEPTGLHAVFKRLWADCAGDHSPTRVQSEIAKHKTVPWPDDADVVRAVETRPLYGSGISKYFILEFDRSLNGDTPSDIPWVEHVLPRNPSEGWWVSFTKSEHEQMHNLLANLIPLSKEMNIDLSNGPYETKKSVISSDSMFKSARQLADKFEEWTPGSIRERGRRLATWAVTRWLYAKPTS